MTILEKLKQIKRIGEQSEISNDDINKLIEIDRFAERHKIPELHEKVAKVITNLEKVVPAREIKLREGETKELNESIAIKRGKDNIIELIVMKRIGSR